MSAADEVTEGVPKDTAYTIAGAPQQQCADNAGGDAGNTAPAAPTTGPAAPAAMPSAGDSHITGVDKQRLVDTPEAPYSAPTSLVPADINKRNDARRFSSAPPRGTNPPVLYVRVPVGRQYPPPEYSRYEQPYRGNWGVGGGPWGGDGGGGGRANQFMLLDDEEWEDAGSFSEATVRRAFIRKVYAILSLQLAFTLGVIAIFMFEPNVKKFVLSHAIVFYMSMVVFLVVYLTLVCCGDMRRRHPCNVILLCIFTLSLSYMMGAISAMFSAYIVFMAVAMTTAIVLVVTLVATFSKCCRRRTPRLRQALRRDLPPCGRRPRPHLQPRPNHPSPACAGGLRGRRPGLHPALAATAFAAQRCRRGGHDGVWSTAVCADLGRLCLLHNDDAGVGIRTRRKVCDDRYLWRTHLHPLLSVPDVRDTADHGRPLLGAVTRRAHTCGAVAVLEHHLHLLGPPNATRQLLERVMAAAPLASCRLCPLYSFRICWYNMCIWLAVGPLLTNK